MNPIENSVFDVSQRATLRSALNRIIPARGSLPGVGDLALTAVESEVSATPAARRAFLEGLTTLQLAAWTGYDRPFDQLLPSVQDDLLREVEQRIPAFFDRLVLLAYQSYYTEPRVIAALGLPCAPQPGGYVLPAFDPAALERVLARGPIWRKTG